MGVVATLFTGIAGAVVIMAVVLGIVRLLNHADHVPYDVEAAKARLWSQLNWWRLPPPEGWIIGFNIGQLPPEYYQYVDQHGEIVRPTVSEVKQAVRDWVYIGNDCFRLPDGLYYRLR